MSPPTSLTSKIATGALGFVGITAMAGGVETVLFPEGNVFVKAEWLDALPVGSYRLPGVGLGIGSLVTAFGLHRRPHWSLLSGQPDQPCGDRGWTEPVGAARSEAR